MKKFAVLFIAGLLFSLCLRAQTALAPYAPTLTPAAPNAAALMKFADVPVSPYTGTASVSVPIFTIKAKGISIPISIDYHTGGIRLDEEASSVGLGWALNSGGMITRTINDQDDLAGAYFGNAVPQIQGDLLAYQPANSHPLNADIGAIDSLEAGICPTCSFFNGCPSCPINGNKYMFFFNCSYLVNFAIGGAPGDYNNAFSSLSTSPPYDLEPDTYTFNFLGRSGKFIIKRNDTSIVLEKQENIKIKLINNGPTLFTCTFVITDDNGNKFYFNQPQSAHPAWSANTTPTSWYLSKIVTQQNDVVNFYYSGPGITSLPAENTQSYSNLGTSSGMVHGSSSGTTYNNVALDSISYADGRVQFFSSNGRTDLSGGYQVDSIRVYSKGVNGVKYIKSDKFYYSYFISSPSGISYTQTGDGPLELQRLRLDSVKEISGGSALKPYSFVYNTAANGFGAEKHSYSIDHWGYYNGAGNTVLIPSMTAFYAGNDYSAGPNQYTYSGANREPSFPNSQSFSLHRVNYPTGGSSIFNYEPNQYDYNNSIQKQQEYTYQVAAVIDTFINLQSTNFSGSSTISGTVDFSKLYPLIAPGTTGTNATITISFISAHTNGSINDWTNAEKSSPGKLYFEFNGNITDLASTGLSCPNGPACSLSYPLTISAGATTATWIAHYDNTAIPNADFSLIRVEITYNALETVVNSNPTLTAGGLRIHSIIDSTAASGGSIAKERVWSYNYGSTGQYTYGKLMAFPSYARQELQPTAGGGRLPVLVFFSSSNTPATSCIQGNIVGYSQVTETTINPSNSADNGKIVYSYTNVPDSVISYNTYRSPGIPNMGNNLNGSEISRITYRNNSGSYWKVAETDNYFHTTNRLVYYSPKYRNSVMSVPFGDCDGRHNLPNAGIALFFPSIKSERVLEDSTKNIVYDPADTTKFLTSVTKSYYDNTKHYQVTRSRSVDSKGNTHVSKITYPQDYITSGSFTGNTILDSLIGRNMVGETIEKRDSLYLYTGGAGKVIAASESRYKQLSSGTMVQDKEYKLEAVKPITDFVPMSISGNTYSQDSRYRQLISFDKYDNVNNISQYTLTNELPVSIIWDYHKTSPIAQVKNADTLSIAYTSFEADGMGGWTIPSAARDAANAMTGAQSYNLSSGSVSKGGLISTNTYVISYWTKNVSPLTLTGTVTGYPIKGATINGWTYYEHKVTGIATATLTGTGNIDELRLYPQNAQMTSYTYTPGVGVTTISDARGGINYYEYDAFQRLLDIKDQNGNIVKSFVYHYAGQ